MSKNKPTNEFEELGIIPYKEEESQSQTYIKIPKQFYVCPFYRKFLTPTTRELYAWLVDKMSLSKRTTEEGDKSYVDENGYIYLIFTREKLMQTLSISKQTIANAFKCLQKLGLVYEKKLGQGKTNRIYIGKVKYLTNKEATELIENLDKTDLEKKSKKSTSKKLKSQKSKKSTSRSLKSRLLEVEKIDGTNTNITNTDITDTDISSSNTTFTESETLINYFEKNICKLKKTPIRNFKNYVENNTIPNDFIIAIINYCTELNYNNFAAFKKVIDSYIEKGILTVDEMLQDIKIFRKNKKVQKQIKNPKSQNIDSFNNFEQREYDWPDLEKRLLGWQE